MYNRPHYYKRSIKVERKDQDIQKSDINLKTQRWNRNYAFKSWFSFKNPFFSFWWKFEWNNPPTFSIRTILANTSTSVLVNFTGTSPGFVFSNNCSLHTIYGILYNHYKNTLSKCKTACTFIAWQHGMLCCATSTTHISKE